MASLDLGPLATVSGFAAIIENEKLIRILGLKPCFMVPCNFLGPIPTLIARL